MPPQLEDLMWDKVEWRKVSCIYLWEHWGPIPLHLCWSTFHCSTQGIPPLSPSWLTSALAKNIIQINVGRCMGWEGLGLLALCCPLLWRLGWVTGRKESMLSENIIDEALEPSSTNGITGAGCSSIRVLSAACWNKIEAVLSATVSASFTLPSSVGRLKSNRTALGPN